MHLYNPRAVVEASIMPSFPWLFEVVDEPTNSQTTVSMPPGYGPDEGTLVPNERGEALVAYLKSLKQAPVPGRSKGDSTSGGDAKAQKGSGGSDASGKSKSGNNLGASVYETNCASCHQSDGSGVPGTFPPLKGDPVVTAEDPKQHVELILNGLQGKTIEGTEYTAAMPPFADSLSNDESAVVVNHERKSWGNDAPTITPEKVAEVREMVDSSDGE